MKTFHVHDNSCGLGEVMNKKDRFHFDWGKSADEKGWEFEIFPTAYLTSEEGTYAFSCGWGLWGFRISYDKKMWESADD